MRVLDRLAAHTIRHRVAAAVVGALLIAAATAAIPRLQLDFSLLPLLQANDRARQAVEELQAELPPQYFDLVCTLQWPRPIGAAEMKQLAAFAAALRAADEIAAVTSLADVPVLDRSGPMPRPRPFAETLGDRSAAAAAAEHPLLQRRLISADGSAACLLLTTGDLPGDHGSLAVLEWSEQFAAAHAPPDTRVRFIGGPVAQRAMRTHMIGDMVRSVVLELLAFALLLPLLFRSVRSLLLPLGAMLSALAVYLGVLGAVGGRIGLLDLAIPGLLLVIGLCDSIHLLHRFEEALARTGDRTASLREAVASVGTACLLRL